MKPTSKKTNWYKCDCCGLPVIKLKPKGSEVIVLSRAPVNIILDKTSDDVFWYNRAWVNGREVPDGLKAYRRHKCKSMRA